VYEWIIKDWTWVMHFVLIPIDDKYWRAHPSGIYGYPGELKEKYCLSPEVWRRAIVIRIEMTPERGYRYYVLQGAAPPDLVRSLEEARDAHQAYFVVLNWLQKRGYLEAGIYPPP
jgi:hypothetical protein